MRRISSVVLVLVQILGGAAGCERARALSVTQRRRRRHRTQAERRPPALWDNSRRRGGSAMWHRSLTLAAVCLSACSAREPLDVPTGSAGASGISGASVSASQGGQVAGGGVGASAGASVVGSQGGQIAGGSGSASAAAELVTLATGQLWPLVLAIDGNSVYWANNGAENTSDTAVAKVPLGGGSVTVLVSGVKGI